MGICPSALSEEERLALKSSKFWEAQLDQAKAEDRSIIKLLLLGTGESGKSTIFKQMQILYDSGFGELEVDVFIENYFPSRPPAKCGRMHANFDSGLREISISIPKNGQTGLDAWTAAQHVKKLDAQSANFWVPEVAQELEDAIHRTYEQKAKLQLLDSTSYLLARENLQRIASPHFVPTANDILRARLRTSGIVEKTFKIRTTPFKFLDVGGQRNERRKWIHCFNEVTAVIFVTAISEFDQVLFEDEKCNRLVESMNVFEEICNEPSFDDTAMIVFLNKMDLFREKLAKTRLCHYFEDFRGENKEEPAAIFLREKFVARKDNPEKLLFFHFTEAIDTNNVEKVFEDCRLIILDQNMKKIGLN